MDTIMNERFTPSEIDAIKKEAEYLIAVPIYSADKRAEIVRDDVTHQGRDTRAVAVLTEAMKLLKDELEEKKVKLEVVNTTRNAEHNVAQRLCQVPA